MALNFLIKPSLETKFYIDYDWWESSRDDLQIYLLTHLSEEQQQALSQRDMQEMYDYVHPETGEVFALDALGMAIRESARSKDFISDHIGLIDSVFRAFLVNGNQPLNALELGEATGRNAATILKTIGGVHVYRGIRPHIASQSSEA